MAGFLISLIPMIIPEQLVALRKQRGLTQQALADSASVHVNQIKRYETGTAQPSLEALKKIAVALRVSTDSLLFREGERGPDDDFALLFEAINRFGPDDKKVAKEVLEGLIIKHEARRWSAA